MVVRGLPKFRPSPNRDCKLSSRLCIPVVQSSVVSNGTSEALCRSRAARGLDPKRKEPIREGQREQRATHAHGAADARVPTLSALAAQTLRWPRCCRSRPRGVRVQDGPQNSTGRPRRLRAQTRCDRTLLPAPPLELAHE